MALDIGVIGAGTAGNAAAILLGRAGHAVTIYERVEAPGPVGAGIALQPSGQAVLAHLGLLEPIVARGARIDRLRCLTTRGRAILDLRYADVLPGGFGLGLHRGVLFETLLGAARATPNVKLALGVEVAGTSPDGDARRLFDAEGRALGRHQLVIVADGAGSKLYTSTAIPSRRREYEYGAIWFLAEDPTHEFEGELFQTVEGTRKMIGFLPTGRGPGESGPVVSFFYSVRVDRFQDVIGDLPRMKAEIGRLVPKSGFVLEQITRPEQLLLAKYRDVRMARWHDPAIVFLGDAGHAMSPQLGQGANLALFDAMVLVDRLERASSLERALSEYTALRRAHLGYYQLSTRLLTPLFQSDAPLLGALRDVFLPLAAGVPWIRRQMIQSMAGTQASLLGRTLALPAPPQAPVRDAA